MVPDNPDVESDAQGPDGIYANFREGTFHIDWSTSHAPARQEAAEKTHRLSVNCSTHVSYSRARPRRRWHKSSMGRSAHPSAPVAAGGDLAYWRKGHGGVLLLQVHGWRLRP
jgi:hypothetical protein